MQNNRVAGAILMLAGCVFAAGVSIALTQSKLLKGPWNGPPDEMIMKQILLCFVIYLPAILPYVAGLAMTVVDMVMSRRKARGAESA